MLEEFLSCYGGDEINKTWRNPEGIVTPELQQSVFDGISGCL